MAKEKSILNHTLAGAGAGIVEVLVMQPTDVVKTRYQSARTANLYNQGIARAFVSVVKSEGIAGLYRGIAPVICIVVPRISLQYMGLATFKPIFERMEGRIIPQHTSAGFAGACTGVMQAITLVTPLEMIKVRQQTDLMNEVYKRKYTTMLSTMRTVVKEEGFLALYNGLIPTVVRQSWGLVVKFTGYTEFKRMFQSFSDDKTKPLAPWQHMASGGLANVLVGVANSPPDVVKTRMQDRDAAYKNTWDCMKQMAKNEGLKSFFRGSWLRILRVAPGGAIQFAVYEELASFLDHRTFGKGHI